MDVLMYHTKILYVTVGNTNFLSSLKKAKKLRETCFSNLPFRVVQYIEKLHNLVDRNVFLLIILDK